MRASTVIIVDCAFASAVFFAIWLGTLAGHTIS